MRLDLKVHPRKTHGTADSVVEFKYGQQATAHLQNDWSFTNVSFNAYPRMGHLSCPEELSQLAELVRISLYQAAKL